MTFLLQLLVLAGEVETRGPYGQQRRQADRPEVHAQARLENSPGPRG